MGLEDLQALVLDEADRLLQMGFAEEVCIPLSFYLPSPLMSSLTGLLQVPLAEHYMQICTKQD